MALNFTVSYTFSPGTTISSAQVNTNTSDVANVFTGLEALTKSFANLKVDVDPATALEVATKQYVDHYAGYRRPVLQYGSATTVAVQSGLDGTSGDIPILFSDGSLRTETSTTRTTFNITRNAVLTTSGAQSGLTGATSEATNTWYALYAVKVTDSSSQWVTVGSTVLPLQANFTTLNTAYGANGWVYLGLVRNGDNNGATGDIMKFFQAGNRTIFANAPGGGYATGLLLASATSTSSNLTYTYAAGTGTTQLPANIPIVTFTAHCGTTSLGTATNKSIVPQTGNSNTLATITYHTSAPSITKFEANPIDGVILVTSGGTDDLYIWLYSFVDGVLGVGSNPSL